MSESTIVRGRWVVTGASASDGVVSDGAVVVADGVIQELGSWPQIRARYPDSHVIGSERVAVLPGLINAHHHAHGVSNLQQGIEDQVLEPWILSLRGARPTDIGLDVLLSSARLLRTGVTSVVDVFGARGTAAQYSNRVHRALASYDTAGIRVAFAAGIRDQSFLVAGADDEFLATLPKDARAAADLELPAADNITAQEYLAVMDECLRTYRDHPRIDVWFGPPGPQWVSDQFWQQIAERAAAYDTGIQTHVVESLYEKLHGPRVYGRATVLHLEQLRVLSPRFSLAHGVWLSEAEIAVLAKTGAAVSHNPGSNLRLRAGIAPLNALLDAGVTVALGMDGTTLDDDEDMFAEMRLALRLNRPPQIDRSAPATAQILQLATTGGARLLRKESMLGRLAPGFQADMVLIDTARITWPWVAPEIDPRDLLLLRAKAGDVTTVLVGGEVVLRDGKPTRFDLEATARELAEQLAAVPYPAAAARHIAALLPHLRAFYTGWEIPEIDPYECYNSKR